jgi:hypothetical protein
MYIYIHQALEWALKQQQRMILSWNSSCTALREYEPRRVVGFEVEELRRSMDDEIGEGSSSGRAIQDAPAAMASADVEAIESRNSADEGQAIFGAGEEASLLGNDLGIGEMSREVLGDSMQRLDGLRARIHGSIAGVLGHIDILFRHAADVDFPGRSRVDFGIHGFALQGAVAEEEGMGGDGASRAEDDAVSFDCGDGGEAGDDGVVGGPRSHGEDDAICRDGGAIDDDAAD